MNAVAEWLRTPEGEAWSRDRHAGRPAEFVPPEGTLWRATGPLGAADDPCGRPPVKSTGRKS